MGEVSMVQLLMNQGRKCHNFFSKMITSFPLQQRSHQKYKFHCYGALNNFYQYHVGPRRLHSSFPHIFILHRAASSEYQVKNGCGISYLLEREGYVCSFSQITKSQFDHKTSSPYKLDIIILDQCPLEMPLQQETPFIL